MYDEYFLHKINADFNLSFCRRSFAEFVTEILDVNDTEYNIFLREGHRIFFKVMCPRDCPIKLDWLESDTVGQAQGADPLPPSSTRGKASRNQLDEEITVFSPLG
jgi:hypothetical protein